MPFRGDLPFILIILFLLAVLIVVLLARFKGLTARGRNARSAAGPPAGAARDRTRPCPLCGTMLKRGETVHTKVFPGKPDRLAHIFGCPYCREPEYREKRYCPACRREVPKDGYVIARMFERAGRVHVHVLGCTECRKGT